jgi:antitoxin HicB
MGAALRTVQFVAPRNAAVPAHGRRPTRIARVVEGKAGSQIVVLRPRQNDRRPPRLLQDDASDAERRTGIGKTANEGDAMTRNNPHFGSSVEDFLEAEGILEEATERAIKAVVAWQLKTKMEQNHITKSALAKKLHTSRSQIDRVLDPKNDDVTVATLRKAAEAVGQKLKLELVAA